MRDIVVIVVTIVLVLCGTFISHWYFENSGEKIMTMLETMSGDLDFASNNIKQIKVKELKENWDKIQKIWITLEYHQTINDMEDIVIECCNNYLNGDRNEYIISFEKMKRMIDDLKYREEISLVNIL